MRSMITNMDISFKTPPEETRAKPKDWLDLLKKIFCNLFRACLGTDRKAVQDVTQKQPFFDDELIETDRKRTEDRVIEIFTAELEKGTSWDVQLKNRKAAACKAMESFNKKAEEQHQFSEVSFLHIKQLPEISYQEVLRDKNRLLNPHVRH